MTRAGKSTRVERQAFADEDALQRFIYQNPEALPVDDSDTDLRLHVLGREFPTTSGPIDILATDAEGRVCIIETKFYRNPRQAVGSFADSGLWGRTLGCWALSP